MNYVDMIQNIWKICTNHILFVSRYQHAKWGNCVMSGNVQAKSRVKSGE
jgi:hypothetical protein